jgi:hypothetical protein
MSHVRKTAPNMIEVPSRRVGKSRLARMIIEQQKLTPVKPKKAEVQVWVDELSLRRGIGA